MIWKYYYATTYQLAACVTYLKSGPVFDESVMQFKRPHYIDNLIYTIK